MTDPVHLSPVQPGDTILGRYRVERILGVGGMGVVVAARHLHLDSFVAIKFLLPDILSNAEAVSRFAREAKAAVKIQNEHVSRVTDVGVLENGAPYMVMEYLDGSDLGVLLRTQGRLSIEDAVDFVLQACEAIAEAHTLGIVHRDLKPANLFLVRRSDGSRIVKVLDFGISKTSGMVGSGGTGGMTSTSSMMGSPLYMSPEQLSSARDVDARTDIWALGIILHELLAAQLPFVADSIPQLCVAIMQGLPASLRAARSDVPAGLEAIVLRCLEKDRARRFANVGELARALSEYAPQRSRVSVERVTHLLSVPGALSGAVDSGQSDTTSGSRVETLLVTASGVQAAWGKTAPEKKRSPSRSAALVLGIITLIAVTAGLFAVLRSGPVHLAATPAAGGSSLAAPGESSSPPPGSIEAPAPPEPPRAETFTEPAPEPAIPPPSANPLPRKIKPRRVPLDPMAPDPPKKRNLPGSGLD